MTCVTYVTCQVSRVTDTNIIFCHKICHQTWWSPNLTPNWVTHSSQNLAITKFITKSSTNFCENLVNNLLTLFSDIFLTEFFDHQICHLILHQIWCSPNLVTNLSPNLVTKLVITIFDTLFGDKFVTKFGEHQICHQITHQIWWQIYHQNGCSLILSPNLSPYFGDKFGAEFVTKNVWSPTSITSKKHVVSPFPPQTDKKQVISPLPPDHLLLLHLDLLPGLDHVHLHLCCSDVLVTRLVIITSIFACRW